MAAWGHGLPSQLRAGEEVHPNKLPRRTEAVASPPEQLLPHARQKIVDLIPGARHAVLSAIACSNCGSGAQLMRRREFIGGLAGAAALPLTARAQQAVKLPTIGFLGAASPSAWSEWAAAFERRLSELGWSKGHTVKIEYRWAEGRDDLFVRFAAEFVRLKVDVIVTAASGVPAIKQVTSVIPVVLAIAGDPLGTGLVASLARPGGNVTGLSVQN
jgi:hypothetical protein